MGGLAHRIEVEIEPQEEFSKAVTEDSNIPDDVQIVEDFAKSYQLYSPSTGRVFGAPTDLDTATTRLESLTKHLIDGSNAHIPDHTTGQPASSDANSVIQDVANKRGMGVSKSGNGYTLVSPSTRYSSDV
jgi:hypothetical protein